MLVPIPRGCSCFLRPSPVPQEGKLSLVALEEGLEDLGKLSDWETEWGGWSMELSPHRTPHLSLLGAYSG